ncbi:glutathione S-transferase, putative [Bodo saltans]|uniref:Glutathione S-transferase, putative n=1 Tax=Bodo saltans TaxID=75058 RepID=A0A0S4J2I5_BODSA|nr:glutathione S-transferase, putative [Bodo saltans]|eukprot:CUG23586.1 glutathione S-transferase, putative [Bodo saltans]
MAKAESTLVDVSDKGAFERKASVFRNKIEEGGAHPPAAGRYILYVSYLCPWASRCIAVRKIKGLEPAIAMVVTSPQWAKTRPEADDHEGWVFDATFPGATEEPHGLKTVRDVYDLSLRNSGVDPAAFLTRYTVPILFDNVSGVIVNNESSEIIRFFNDAFNAFAAHPEANLAPAALLPAIDKVNDFIYESVCNGVYKCGFAQSQEAYDAAVTVLFNTLDELDATLATQRYLTGGTPTESDIRLFVTLIRFDEVYAVHFKTNKKLIRDYVHLHQWLRDVYQTLDLAPTVNMLHIKHGYYSSLSSLNRYGIVPVGPDVISDVALPHNRDRTF